MPQYFKSLRDALTPLADALYDRQVRALGAADLPSAEKWGLRYTYVEGRRKRVGVKQTAWIIVPPPSGTEAEFGPRIDRLAGKLHELTHAFQETSDLGQEFETLMAEIDDCLDQHP